MKVVDYAHKFLVLVKGKVDVQEFLVIEECGLINSLLQGYSLCFRHTSVDDLFQLYAEKSATRDHFYSLYEQMPADVVALHANDEKFTNELVNFYGDLPSILANMEVVDTTVTSAESVGNLQALQALMTIPLSIDMSMDSVKEENFHELSKEIIQPGKVAEVDDAQIPTHQPPAMNEMITTRTNEDSTNVSAEEVPAEENNRVASDQEEKYEVTNENQLQSEEEKIAVVREESEVSQEVHPMTSFGEEAKDHSSTNPEDSSKNFSMQELFPGDYSQQVSATAEINEVNTIGVEETTEQLTEAEKEILYGVVQVGPIEYLAQDTLETAQLGKQVVLETKNLVDVSDSGSEDIHSPVSSTADTIPVVVDDNNNEAVEIERQIKESSKLEDKAYSVEEQAQEERAPTTIKQLDTDADLTKSVIEDTLSATEKQGNAEPVVPDKDGQARSVATTTDIIAENTLDLLPSELKNLGYLKSVNVKEVGELLELFASFVKVFPSVKDNLPNLISLILSAKASGEEELLSQETFEDVRGILKKLPPEQFQKLVLRSFARMWRDNRRAEVSRLFDEILYQMEEELNV